MKKRIIAAAILLLTIITAICVVAADIKRTVVINPEALKMEIDDKFFGFGGEMFEYNGHIYLSADNVLPLFGCALGWEAEKNAVSVNMGGKDTYIYVDSNEYETEKKSYFFAQPTKIYDGQAYIHTELLEKIISRRVKTDGKVLEMHRDKAVFYADESRFSLNGEGISYDGYPIKLQGKILYPVREVLSECGYSLSYEKEEVIAEKYGQEYKIGKDKVSGTKTSVKEGYTMFAERPYVTAEVLSYITNFEISLEGSVRENAFGRRDTLENTVQSDAFRKIGPATTYNGVTVANGRGMELALISSAASEKYAYMVNEIAEKLGGVNVYCIMVPTASEFYSPKDLRVNQLGGIKAAYAALSDKVTPINVYSALQENADENIYFGTDHHWTQRGAYYAYREFANQKGMYLPAIDMFECEETYGFLGSFASFADGTPGAVEISANPDVLEKYYPAVKAKCEYFGDTAMKNKIGEGELVEGFTSYMAFLGGDYPVTRITTDVKNGKKLVVLKESYGNAFTTWAVNNYEEVYAVDPRKFNGFQGNEELFSLIEFYENVKFDDLVVINYPISAASEGIRSSIQKMID